MSLTLRLPLALAIMCLAVQSCKKPPQRIDISKIQGATRDDSANPSTEPTVDNLGESTSDPETGKALDSANPAARKNTIQSIMLTAGDKLDQSCKSETLEGRHSLRLLTKDEYQNTVASILKTSSDFRAKLPREVIIEGFRNNIDYGRVSDEHASAYLETAIQIADEINPTLTKALSCSGLDEACASKFIDTYVARLWRRSLEASEKEVLKASYKKGSESSPQHGMTMLISRVLLSPNFLYRSEIGKAENGNLSPFELASSLSYFFWGFPPDDLLWETAVSGKITNEKTLIAQVERMLLDPKAKFVSNEFVRAWMDTQAVRGVIKDDSIFPKFDQKIKDAMVDEAENTFDSLLRAKGTSFSDLFTTNYSLGNSTLASYYGASYESGKISFKNTTRKGVLAYGALLARLSSPKETHPIRRGSFVLEKVFCSYPEPTPPGLNVEFPPFDPSLSTRERFAKHTADANCASCHKPIDGIGLGMEDFDGGAQFRAASAGKKIDSSGLIIGIDGKTTSFNGLGELSDYIASSKQARRCFAVEWYRLAHGHMERPKDVCAIRDLANSMEAGNLSLSEFLIKLVTHPSYRSKGE